MASIAHWFGSLELKDWIAIYAAMLSTGTAFVQFANARRNRPLIRLKIWKQALDKRHPGSREHMCVSVVNIGDKSLPIYPPLLELAHHTDKVSRIYRASPEEIAENYNWIPLDYYDIEQPFELHETNEQTYRFTLPHHSRVLGARVVDRAGVVRFRRRTLAAPWHRAVFYVKHFWRLLTKPKKRPENKIGRAPAT